ncbi:hypothetical protein OKC48_20810 [Methylorubrum extorquens]|uniref:hypothetical protein n=1 Tax=Methylorubrum extorquens TaxID=408 RepID=UPI002238FC6C|nr:hypothetical protein [Methylorubrum extorquens]UYW25689.1 hypothetical protein OKC48_20810 [Methylorubrum extorquens]
MRGWVRGALALAAVVAAGQAWAQGTTTPGAAVEASTRETITLWVAIFGAFTGGIGAVLGVYNALVARDARKVRLKIVPGWSLGPGFIGFSIEVVNHSSFGVTVDQIGFLERGSKRTITIARPILGDGGEWPRKLGPQEAVNVYLDLHSLPEGIHLGEAFAQTVSDERRTGTTAALQQLTRLVRSGALDVPPQPRFMPPGVIRTTNVVPELEPREG